MLPTTNDALSPRPASNLPKVSRRSFLAATAVATTMATQAFGNDYGPGARPARYPDADIITLDKRFL